MPKEDKWISELVGIFCDPILVMPGGWGDTLPDWLKHAVTMERLFENLKGVRGEEMTGTDAEVVCYLYTASLEAPMDSEWTNIYIHVAGRVYEKWRTPDSKVPFPDDIRVEKLSQYETQELASLKRWLYEHRVRARKDRDRTERREAKIEAIEDARIKYGEQIALKM